MKKEIKPLLISFLILFVCSFAVQAGDTISLYKLLAAENEIVKHYVDEVDEQKLVENAVRGDRKSVV